MVSQESKTSSHGSANHSSRRARKPAAPLDETALRDLALSYAARFASTAAKLEAYLARKIRERGVAQDADGRACELDVPALVARLVDLGYVDDAAYAHGRARDLVGRGYGKRRVEQALWAAGVAEETRADNAPGEAQGRRAAMLLAQKRRFGPYDRSREAPGGAQGGDGEAARKTHEKQVAAMLRAGHVFEHVQFILAASQTDVIEEWVAEAEEDERNDQ